MRYQDTYVDGYIGNTYGGEFEAAHGYFKDFYLYPYETRDAPSDKLAAAVDFANTDWSGNFLIPS